MPKLARAVLLLSIVGILGCARKPVTTATAQYQAPTISKLMSEVQAYAGGRKVTVTKHADWIWVEVDGLAAHGVGKTVDEAAQDFLFRADLLDHEPKDPAHASSSFACPILDECI